MPGGFNAIPEITARRAALVQMISMQTADLPPNENVTTEERTIPGTAGDIAVRVYRPAGADGVLPGILFIHGGGMVIGNLDVEEGLAQLLAEEIGAVVVSTDYRKAPEHAHPAQSDDTFAALQWMGANADELGYDPERLAVYGGSAGGNLALATALRARDDDGPKLKFVMAIYPMEDESNTTASSHAITDVGIWDRAANLEAWDWFLGGKEADGIAAPLKADLAGLPPVFIDVGDVDLFRDED
ncbi:MAG: alpha/beta hydrolase, partial [Propionibacterium sp.]|nr:alpha/beta hydrolase [Propionibacterium sp.]